MLQITFRRNATEAAHFSELLSELGALAVTLQDAADQPLYEPPLGSTPLWERTDVVALFEANANIESVLDVLRSTFPAHAPLRYTVTQVEDRDWQRECLDQFKPLKFGERLWVCPSWHETPEPDAANIILDPGLAFGTGTHPTTALCLEWLDAHDVHGLDVLDYGCGSGILALAAAKLGAVKVWAVDHDPQALTATRANAVQNGLGATILTMAPEQLPAVQADLILANILANVLGDLAARFAGLLKPGGRLVLSGILFEQAEQLVQAYRPWFEVRIWREREGWVCLEGIRKSD